MTSTVSSSTWQAATRYATDLARLMGAGDDAVLARSADDVASADALERWLREAANAVERRAGPGRSVVFLSKMAKRLPASLSARLLAPGDGTA